mmetsp:Transcript_16688/g.28709  ORF Transcript_16688/g.28709 Transcript_16688/m.28709 type:complete len:163 (-) Transcript_16688:74-562(-)|eukprot:CAMPEP_0183740292 /NCGR_PEP_ID=MMETSP0737-20130205/59225_1 /TAXON_ID=385413 /ORGANISM="Thalassiosira miniscula, Strain CCMP1093" /LENGTH=162 /DNA_ID=CAMNT_0025975307 /DNA_START=239 /DNA_END=727 /DNA_ORIENTATION=-
MKSSRSESRTELIEDWPHNLTKTEVKCIRFSDTHRMYQYRTDLVYEASKSFTKADQKSFRRDSLQEAIRIKRALVSREKKSGGGAREKEHIEPFEVVGLEHLILDDPRKHLRRRKNHVEAVLTEQATQKNEGCNDDKRLAMRSQILSKGTKLQAQHRASRAA